MGIKYVGLDVHVATTSYCVRDSEGRVKGEGVLETTAGVLESFVKGLSGEVHVAFEECSLADWLYEVISPVCAKLVVCDARQTHAKKQAKSDRIDAKWLSELLRLGSLAPVFHGNREMRALRESVRCHRDLVRDSTRQKNRLKVMFQSRGIACMGSAVYEADKRQDYLCQLKEVSVRRRAEHYYRILDELQLCRRASEKEMVREARKHRGYELVKTVPGLGRLNSAKVVGWTVTPHRFPSKRKFAKYCGLAVVQRASAEWKKGPTGLYRDTKVSVRGLNRDFHRELKPIFKNAALIAVRRYSEWREYYEDRRMRGVNEAMIRVTLARKLTAICWSVWRKGEPYSVDKIR